MRAAGRALVHDRVGRRDALPVLLLHGITGSRHYWDRAHARLGRSHQLLIPDLMGFGSSPKPRVQHDVDAFAHCVRAFLEEHGLDRRPLLACCHSLGALVILRYAVLWPGHLRAAFLINLPTHASREEAHRHFLRGSGNYRRLLGEGSLRRTLASWLEAGPRMAARYAVAFSPRIAADSRRWTYHSLTSTIEHALLEHRAESSLRELHRLPRHERPELALLHGERDQVTPLHRVREVARDLPHVPLHVIRGTGHHPFRTHSREVLDLVEPFLAAAARGTGAA